MNEDLPVLLPAKPPAAAEFECGACRRGRCAHCTRRDCTCCYGNPDS